MRTPRKKSKLMPDIRNSSIGQISRRPLQVCTAEIQRRYCYRCVPNVTRASLMSATKLATLSQKPIPSPDKTIESFHINRVEVGVCLLELVRRRAIDHPASEFGHSEELLRAWREAFRLVEQGRLRIRVAFEDINRLLVVPDVELKLQRARLLLCRGHKLWYQRRELVH